MTTLHTRKLDLLLHFHKTPGEVNSGLFGYYLIDEAGNYIVDEGANRIKVVSEENATVLHARPTATLIHMESTND